MKEKKFKFEQTVITIVETKYVYKVDAKSHEQAEKKFKEAFDKKLEKGTSITPVKKYLSKISVVNSELASPELLGKSTMTVSSVPSKHEGDLATELYNNQDNSWINSSISAGEKEDEEIL